MNRAERRLISMTATALLAIAIPACASAASAGTMPPADPFTTQSISAIPLDEATRGGALVMDAHAQTFRAAPLLPAPLPDRDVSAPEPGRDALAAQADPSVEPGFFNPQSHFAGDGYASGSSIETDQNHRHSTGGGMNLSIPMQ